MKQTAMGMAPAFLAVLSGLSAFAQSAPPNGVEATSTPLSRPHGVAYDTAGNLYIADTDQNVIRKVTPAGIITTVAGDGEQGYAGDGGLATAAILDSPAGVAVDSNGNIYIADTHNNVIREVTASTGNINTIAGTGVAGFSGDGSAATSATLSYPNAVAVDSNGNVYIADTKNHRIREIVAGAINTVAGDRDQAYLGDGIQATATGLDSPDGVAVDSSFNIYIGDTHNQRVRLVTYSTGIVTTLAGTGTKGFTSDGPATSVALARPRGVTVDGSGNVYLADSDNNRIRTISGGNITTIAGSGAEGFSGDGSAPSTSASLDTPGAVAVSGTSILFSDTENDVVRLLHGGIINTVAGQSSNAESLVISGPASSVIGAAGTLTATFTNGGNVASGLVTFYDGEGASRVAIGSSPLSGNTASVSTSALSVGTHTIVASYAGDANAPAISSGVFVFLVTPRNVIAITLSPAALPNATVGTAYSQLLTATGGISSYSYTVSNGNLPPGLTLNNNSGLLSGSPTGGGLFNFTVQAEDSNSDTGSEAYSLNVAAPTVTLAPTTLPNGTYGASYNQAISASGGTSPYTYQVVPGSGSPPGGLSLSTIGTLMGTPTAAGPFSFTVQATDHSTGIGPYTGTQAYSVNISKATASVSVASSANPVLVQNSVTLTANLTSGAGTPTGTVTFLDGTTPIGSGVLTGGVATLGTSSLADGTHSMTAVYGGDPNYLAVTSSPLTELVEDFSFTISTPAVTAQPGGSAVFNFTVTPVGAATFPANITLSLSGLPEGATYTFSPATLTAGESATQVTLTIALQQAQASAATTNPSIRLATNTLAAARRNLAGRLAPFSLAFILLPFAGRMRRAGRRMGRMLSVLLLLAAGMTAVAGISGCGSNGGLFSQQKQTYTITVTGTAGNLSHSTTVTLSVE